MCGWQKMTSVRFSVRFCKKLRFSVQFRFYNINRGFGFFGSVWRLQTSTNINLPVEQVVLLRLPYSSLWIGFLPARRYASAGLYDSDVSVRLSGRLSGRLSHTGIVPSRAKAGLWNVHRLIASSFWRGMIHRKIRNGSPQRNVPNEGGLVFSAIFHQYVVISRKLCILHTKLL